LFPLGPRGIWSNFRTVVVNSLGKNASGGVIVVRCVSVALAIGSIWLVGGTKGVLLGYVLSLFLVYPWFAWISLMAEHRWFCRSDTDDSWKRECENCRPTDFPGPVGWVIWQLVFPMSDKFHLAHSLYRYVRWSYLPTIDRRLSKDSPEYAAHRSEGLLFARAGRPAALSELRERLTGRRDDVAPWGQKFHARPDAAGAWPG
jgi:fatty acid desaturase